MEHRKRSARGATTSHKIPTGDYESEADSSDRRSRKNQLGRFRQFARRSQHGSKKRKALFYSFVIGVIGFLALYGFLLYNLADIVNFHRNKVVSKNRVLSENVPDITLSTSFAVNSLPERPRIIGYYFESQKSESFLGVERINPNALRVYNSSRAMMSAEEIERQEDLEDSKDYRNGRADVFEKGDCVAQYDWQKSSRPTCNNVMETDWTNLALNTQGKDSVKLIASGFWRDVWRIRDSQSSAVLKSIRYEHDFEERNFDRHRRDAVAMERLTSSPYVMDVYAFCGNSGLFEFADGGSVEYDIWYTDDDEVEWTPQQKVVMSYQLARGLADAHNSDKEGVPSIAHVDITPSQFVYVKESGIYKLNDFNRCRLLRKNTKTNEICPYKVGNNPGTFRSPEEYAYEPQTEKVDIYSLGNVYYGIVTELWPFYHQDEEDSQEKLMAGKRPPIEEKFRESKDPFDQAMITAIEKCWVHDPKERITARELQNFFFEVLRKQGVDPEVVKMNP